MKESLRDRFALFLIPLIGWILIRILGMTWRFTTLHEEAEEKARAYGHPSIYALWHGRMLPLVYRYRSRNAYALVSQHMDGELAVRLVHKLGYRTVRGSSTRGGVRGSQDLLRVLQAGSEAAIMPDGPRGPARKVQPGVLRLAQLSGCPIIPISASASKRYTVKSWDSFIIPKPFARCVVVYGTPVDVPTDASPHLLNEKQTTLEDCLNRITDEADTYFE